MCSLNRCSLYLQVYTFSDIVTADGCRFLPEIKKGQCTSSRESSLLWPVQGNPPNADWNLWRKYLGMFESSNKLSSPLGKWLASTYQHWHWFLDPIIDAVMDMFATPLKNYHPLIS
jgi:hypothetical protein